MSYEKWSEKLSENIKKYASKEIEEKVLEDCVNLDTLEQKGAWAKQAIKKLDKLVPDREIRINILTNCSCIDEIPNHDDIKADFKKHKDIDKLLDDLYENPFFVRPVRQDNKIYFTKMPQQPEKFEQAQTADEKRFYYCHCDYAKASGGNISMTHCLCGAGWYKKIMESLLDKPVKIDIIKSVMKGDEECVIEMEI